MGEFIYEGMIRKAPILYMGTLLTYEDCQWFVDKEYELMEEFGANNSWYKEQMLTAIMYYPKFEHWLKGIRNYVKAYIND